MQAEASCSDLIDFQGGQRPAAAAPTAERPVPGLPASPPSLPEHSLSLRGLIAQHTLGGLPLIVAGG